MGTLTKEQIEQKKQQLVEKELSDEELQAVSGGNIHEEMEKIKQEVTAWRKSHKRQNDPEMLKKEELLIAYLNGRVSDITSSIIEHSK